MKNSLINIVGAVSLLVATSIVSAAPLIGKKSVDVDWTTFCDGMHLEINWTSGVVTGIRTGCGINPVPVWGRAVSDAQKGVSLSVTTTHSDGTGALHFVIDNAPKKMFLETDLGFTDSSSYTIGIPAFTEGPRLPISGE